MRVRVRDGSEVATKLVSEATAVMVTLISEPNPKTVLDSMFASVVESVTRIGVVLDAGGTLITEPKSKITLISVVGEESKLVEEVGTRIGGPTELVSTVGAALVPGTMTGLPAKSMMKLEDSAVAEVKVMDGPSTVAVFWDTEELRASRRLLATDGFESVDGPGATIESETTGAPMTVMPPASEVLGKPDELVTVDESTTTVESEGKTTDESVAIGRPSTVRELKLRDGLVAVDELASVNEPVTADDVGTVDKLSTVDEPETPSVDIAISLEAVEITAGEALPSSEELAAKELVAVETIEAPSITIELASVELAIADTSDPGELNASKLVTAEALVTSAELVISEEPITDELAASEELAAVEIAPASDDTASEELSTVELKMPDELATVELATIEPSSPREPEIVELAIAVSEAAVPEEISIVELNESEEPTAVKLSIPDDAKRSDELSTVTWLSTEDELKDTIAAVSELTIAGGLTDCEEVSVAVGPVTKIGTVMVGEI